MCLFGVPWSIAVNCQWLFHFSLFVVVVVVYLVGSFLFLYAVCGKMWKSHLERIYMCVSVRFCMCALSGDVYVLDGAPLSHLLSAFAMDTKTRYIWIACVVYACIFRM